MHACILTNVYVCNYTRPECVYFQIVCCFKLPTSVRILANTYYAANLNFTNESMRVTCNLLLIVLLTLHVVVSRRSRIGFELFLLIFSSIVISFKCSMHMMVSHC